MALQHLRSGTANKRANPAAMADGQLAMNTNSTSPGLFLKDSAGNLVKVGPVHVGTTAPNASPATGGSAGNSVGEQWLDTSSGTYVFRVWDGSAWRSEAGEFVNATGDTMTGALVMDNQQQVRFRETTANGTNYIALQAPASVASDKTITLPDVTGTVVTTGDTGTVTSTMLLDGTIVNADVNAAAAIAGTKINPDFGSQNVTTTGTSTAASFIPTSSTAPSNGLYLSGTNTVALATNGTGRLFVDASGRVSIGVATFSKTFNVIAADASINLRANSVGTYTDHGIFFAVDGVNYSQIYNDGVGQLIFRTGSGLAERMRLDSSGRLGLGNSAPGNLLTLGTTSPTLEFNDSDSATDNKRWVLYTGATNLDIGARTDAGAGGGNLFRFNRSNEQVQSLQGFKDGAAWFHVDNSTARVGIGTTSPAYALDVVNTITGVSFANSMHWNYPGLILRRNASNVSTAKMLSMMLNGDSESDTVLTNYLNIWGTYSGTPTTGSTSTGLSAVMNLGAPSGIAAHVNGSEAFRVDASRRLLVGTSTASAADASVIVQGNAQSSAFGSRLYLSRGEANPVDNVGLGQLNFSDSTHTVSSMIRGARDGGTWGASSKPGRLEFSTTADGASSPTERMRIGSNGAIRVGQTTTDAPGYQNTTQGISLEGNTGGGFFSRSGSFALHVNRITNDGDIVVIAQDGTQEGSISVNGTTVSYNGAHLSRWSQLPGNAERIEILRGTVLSNIDEMCGWGEEDNEQLNRMKVSDIEGDPNVSGVFQAWDDDDDTYTDDFYCAMTGDFIIRIAEGVTVQRGDLLMSAGDGSAKPQDDDIVRSKTVAKVTSTHVTCTYDDGSYCVPCVLMAC